MEGWDAARAAGGWFLLAAGLSFLPSALRRRAGGGSCCWAFLLAFGRRPPASPEEEEMCQFPVGCVGGGEVLQAGVSLPYGVPVPISATPCFSYFSMGDRGAPCDGQA